jgi:hypothetical protein
MAETTTKPTMLKTTPMAALFFRKELPDPAPVSIFPPADCVSLGTLRVELKRRLDVELWPEPGRLVMVEYVDVDVVDPVVLEDEDEEDEEVWGGGVELEELEDVDEGDARGC